MQSSSLNHDAMNTAQSLLRNDAGVADATSIYIEDYVQTPAAPAEFHGAYAGRMEMNADRSTVAAYLDAHQDWFHRCARPMTAESIQENGYALIIGKFNSFGYEVEPKVGLHLLPQDHGVYRIQTIPVPGYEPPGYDVDFCAQLELREEQVVAADGSTHTMTQVDWELDLKVYIHFPRFIRALPQGLIQTTGDGLLNQIVRQASRRLTRKVQEEFHQSRGLPLPASAKRHTAWCRH